MSNTEDLLKEIINGKRKRDKLKEINKWSFIDIKGIGSKSYITKRIDLLREKLLELKKNIK